jgi:hypothetical protein
MTVSLVDEGARYQIRVQGRLRPEWSTRLGDLKLAVHGGRGHPAVTDLSGWVADQAALMGVLQQLYGLGVTILRVERLARGSAGARDAQRGT